MGSEPILTIPQCFRFCSRCQRITTNHNTRRIARCLSRIVPMLHDTNSHNVYRNPFRPSRIFLLSSACLFCCLSNSIFTTESTMLTTHTAITATRPGTYFGASCCRNTNDEQVPPTPLAIINVALATDFRASPGILLACHARVVGTRPFTPA